MSDWDTVTVLKKKPLKSAQMKTEAAINQASKTFVVFSRVVKMANTLISIYFIAGRQGLDVETHQKCK